MINTWSCFAKTINNPINLLEVESDTAMKWFPEIQMIVNAEKFKAIVSIRNKSGIIWVGFSFTIDIVSIEESAKFLWIYLNNCLNFKIHINTICISSKECFEQKNVFKKLLLSNIDYFEILKIYFGKYLHLWTILNLFLHKEIFFIESSRYVCKKLKLNLEIPKTSQVSFGTKSFGYKN